jgi:hypothetical protein
MPYQTAAKPRHKGWWHDQINGRIVAVFNGTEIFDFDGNDVAMAQALTHAAIVTHSAELRVAQGQNVRLGTINTFGTTEPTNAVVMKEGTEFAGAITTSGGLMSSATVVRKVIAAGTVSNVET